MNKRFIVVLKILGIYLRHHCLSNRTGSAVGNTGNLFPIVLTTFLSFLLEYSSCCWSDDLRQICSFIKSA